MTKFVTGGPPRYKHQIRGLKKLIETGGVGALLFEPGLGKTSTALDFSSLLALKQPPIDGVQEARVLVICPLAAVDTWVKEAAKYVSPQVNYWAEAVGGSIKQRAETIAARGGSPFTRDPVTKTPKKGLPRRNIGGVYMDTPVRAEGWQRSIDWGARSDARKVRHSDGPDGVGTNLPRLIIEVLNLDTFASRQRMGNGTVADMVLEGVKRYNPHLVIVDESHKIKSATSNVSRLLDRIGPTVPKRILLTGTVMPAGPLDIFGQWRFLDPYAFGEKQADGSIKRTTFDSFKRRFAVMGGYLGHEVIGYRNLDELEKIMSQRAIVARKKDALDMPPVIEVVVPVMLTPTEKKAYAEMKKNLAAQFNGNGGLMSGNVATASNRLAQMMRLRQITAGHLPDDLGIVRELGTSKADTIASIAHDTLAGEDRIVVFCMFTHELQTIKERLERKGTLVMTISGATPNDERLRIRARFGSEEATRMILVAQVKTISLAVNELVTAQHVIFGSLTQQRDDLIQAIDRLNRIGQKGSVTAWFAEAPGTIDTVIHSVHRDRTDLEAAVLRHVLEKNEDVDE